MLTNKQSPFHVFSFPQLPLWSFHLFIFAALHKFRSACLAFFRTWCASQMVMKAFLRAPHDFLSCVLGFTKTRKLQSCLATMLIFLLLPLCRQHECLSTPKRGEEWAVKFLFPLFFSLFFSLFPIFSAVSPSSQIFHLSLISLLTGLFYLLLHHSASLPHVFKEGKHKKHVCHVITCRSFHTTFRFCHVSLKLWCLHLF